MKKYLTLKMLGLVTIITIAISSCQKDATDASLTQSANAKDEMTVIGQAVKPSSISGLISEEAAEEMRENFGKTYKTKNETEYVAFSVNDMANYLQQLKAKYKSDSVYVSFGVYDEKTAVNKKDIGRVTVFFVGKNKVSVKGNIRSQDDVANPFDGGSNYFNHGSIWP
ncbi:MAG: hypothetical protein Q8K64_02990 [Sediminibacterium sp.]|nr:hypothetical protein [Sediminibacterium sp.]